MNLGDLCSLYLTVPWRGLEIVHSRGRLIAGSGDTVYSSRVEVDEVVEVLPFDMLSDAHVTKGNDLYRSAGESIIDIWALRGIAPYGADYTFILCEEHATLYNGIMKPYKTGGGNGANSSSGKGYFDFAARLHGAQGSGKSHALLYCLFRELAAGRGCMVIRKPGKMRVLYYLKADPSSEATTDDSASNNQPPRGFLVQIINPSDNRLDGNSAQVLYLKQESGDQDTIHWCTLQMKDIKLFMRSFVTSDLGRSTTTERIRLALMDGASTMANEGTIHVPLLLFVGERFTFNSPISEWYWKGLSPVQVSLCRLLCWKRGPCCGGERRVSDEKMYEYAGADLRLASVIHYWEDCDWLEIPLAHTLSKLPLAELVTAIDVEDWTIGSAKNLAVVRMQLKPGQVEGKDFEPGQSCLPYLQKVVFSEFVRDMIQKRLTWTHHSKLFALLSRNRHPALISAIARQVLHKYGLTLATKVRRDEGQTLVIRRIPAAAHFVYGATAEDVLSPYPPPSEGPRETICFVNTSTASAALVVKLPVESSTGLYAAGWHHPRNFALVGFRMPRKADIRTGPQTFDIKDEELDLIVNVRVEMRTSAAVNILHKSSCPEKEQVWIIEKSALDSNNVIAAHSFRPRVCWLLRKLFVPSCTTRKLDAASC